MHQASIGDLTLEYEMRTGDGPVVFIHGAFISDTFSPLLDEPLLSSRTLVNYRRRGYGQSSPPPPGYSIGNHAEDCFALMRHLGIDAAHVVAHSLGGAIALQLALDAPDAVRSLALLEPALAIGESGDQYRESLRAVIERRGSASDAEVIAGFLQARWPGYEAPLEAAIPGAFEQAVRDAPSVFEIELPGLIEWAFSERDAGRIAQPTVCVLGGNSPSLSPRFGEVHRLLLATMPAGGGFEVEGASHLMQVEKPREVAGILASFYDRLDKRKQGAAQT
jgi:pimeloyl-ACP methyl ester carboxylesterase